MKFRVLPAASVTAQTTWRKLLMALAGDTGSRSIAHRAGMSSWKPRESLPTNPTPELVKPTMTPASLMPRAARVDVGDLQPGKKGWQFRARPLTSVPCCQTKA